MNPSQEKLRGLQEAFRQRLGARYQEMELALFEFLHEGDEGRLRDLHRYTHNLMGSAASYGYAEIGQLAARLEAIASAWLDGRSAEARDAKRVLGLMRRRIGSSSIPGPYLLADATHTVAPGSRTVYFLEDDTELADLVSEQLQPYGYVVSTFDTAAALLEAVRRELPSALLFDVELSGEERGPSTALELPEEVRAEVPIVFLTAHEDLQSRLEAVRAGAAAFLTKPPDLDAIVELLDRLTRLNEIEPYRVLIVDDSSATADFYAASLNQAGMVTAQVANAVEAMTTIQEFGPEIILLDLYMPGVNGNELAQIIRQFPSLASIPIVFVSAEQDETLQVAAMGQGGDDFITKPVNVHHLQSSVKARAERYRQLRALSQQDSLTGLLNHRSCKDALDFELARTGRTGSPLSVGLLDIDHFKSVNDTYGHPAGDVVIKRLARVLTQRLRRSDVIGRYGGEEFLVLLPDASAAHAHTVLEELRRTFEGLTHQDSDRSFCCSISCGLAEARPGETTDEVLRRVDGALYAAKERGRNRVVVG